MQHYKHVQAKYLQIHSKQHHFPQITKSVIDAYRLTTVRVNEMFASCLQRRGEIMIS